MEGLEIKVTQFAIEHHIFTWVNVHCQKQEYLIQYSPYFLFNISNDENKRESVRNNATSPGLTQLGMADSLKIKR